MKNLRYLNIFTILIIYTLLMFYIGWNGWVWLHAVFGWESWGYYAFIVAFISYAYILVQVFKFLPFLRTIGSIWFAVIQYALMLLPLANIMVFLLQFSVEKEEAIIWTGAAVIVHLSLSLRTEYLMRIVR